MHIFVQSYVVSEDAVTSTIVLPENHSTNWCLLNKVLTKLMTILSEENSLWLTQ